MYADLSVCLYSNIPFFQINELDKAQPYRSVSLYEGSCATTPSCICWATTSSFCASEQWVPQLQPAEVQKFSFTRRWSVFMEQMPHICDSSRAFCLSYSHSPCSGLSSLWKGIMFILVGEGKKVQGQESDRMSCSEMFVCFVILEKKNSSVFWSVTC